MPGAKAPGVDVDEPPAAAQGKTHPGVPGLDVGVDQQASFTPFSSVYQLRRPEQGEDPSFEKLTDPYSAEPVVENMFSGVASPADMFIFGYASLDLQAELLNTKRRLLNTSLTGYLQSKPYMTPAALNAYEAFVLRVWGLPAYMISALDCRDYAAYCYGAADEPGGSCPSACGANAPAFLSNRFAKSAYSRAACSREPAPSRTPRKYSTAYARLVAAIAARSRPRRATRSTTTTRRCSRGPRPRRGHGADARVSRKEPELAASPGLSRNRDFMLLWSGQALSSIGSAVTRVAYPLLVLAPQTCDHMLEVRPALVRIAVAHGRTAIPRADTGKHGACRRILSAERANVSRLTKFRSVNDH